MLVVVNARPVRVGELSGRLKPACRELVYPIWSRDWLTDSLINRLVIDGRAGNSLGELERSRR